MPCIIRGVVYSDAEQTQKISTRNFINLKTSQKKLPMDFSLKYSRIELCSCEV